MDRAVKLSLITLMFIYYANADELTYNDIIINTNTTILDNTYKDPTNITFNGSTLNLGSNKTSQSFNDMKINITKSKAMLVINGYVSLDNVNIFKNLPTDSSQHGLVINNSGSNKSAISMSRGSLKNIGLNLYSNADYQDSFIFDSVNIDNVIYGQNTARSANLTILNSTISNSKFNYETLFANSTLSGTNEGNLNIQKGEIHGTIKATDLKISDLDSTAYTHDKLDISSNSNIQLSNSTLNNADIKLTATGRLITANAVLDNVNISKANAVDKEVHGIVINNNTNFSITNGNLTNIGINLNSVNGGHSGISTLDSVKLDNIKYGYNTDLSAKLIIKNSNINNSDFKHETLIDNSTLTGTNIGNLNITNNTKIQGDIDATNLIISSSSANGINSKLNLTSSSNINIKDNSLISNTNLSANTVKISDSIVKGLENSNISINSTNNMELNNVDIEYANLSSSSNRIDINGTSIFNDIKVENKSLKGTSHHITIGNNADVVFNGGTFINTAINNYSSTYSNKTTINNATLINTSIGSATPSSFAPIYINNSKITNTDENASIVGGNVFFDNVEVESNFNTNAHFANGSKVKGSILGGDFYYSNGNTYEVNFIDGRLIFVGEHTMNDYILKLNNPTNIQKRNGKISLDYNTQVTFNNANFENIQIGAADIVYDSKDKENNTIILNNSNIIESGIGAVRNGGIFLILDNVYLNNTKITNTLDYNGIHAGKVYIKGGEITAPEIRTIDNDWVRDQNYNVTKIGTLTDIDGAIINANIETETLNLRNHSKVNGNIQGTKIVNIYDSTLVGDITRNDRDYCKDFGCSGEIEQVKIHNSNILGNINEIGDLELKDSKLSGEKVIVKNNVLIDNQEQTTLNADFEVGNNITTNNTHFSGKINAQKLLSDTKSVFEDTVSAGSINANGSTFNKTLTITGNSKNNILNNATLKNGLNVDSKDASISIVNNSQIMGNIQNEGLLNVDKNSTISNQITGSGTLNTDTATYKENVTMGKISGSGNNFIADVTLTGENNEINLSDNMFAGNITVDNGTINANSSYNLKNVNSNNMNIKNDDINTKDEIVAKNIEIKDTLFIENINVKTTQLKAKKAQITNSNVTSEVFLKGLDDTALNVYDNSKITSGNYTISNSAIKGGIRVDELTVNNSNIVGQLAVNKLNATNSTFYITGGGYNTSLYQHFSGAIIAKEGASGSKNTINISNTNLGQLINGYVPIAIINNLNKPVVRAASNAEISTINKDYFNVTYTTPISTVLLNPNIVHYRTISQDNGLKAIWSVGLAGGELSEDDISDIIDGKGNANYTTTQIVDKNYKNYILHEIFDKDTKNELNNIIYSPYFVARNTAKILKDRATYLRSNPKNQGFWIDNNYSYNFYKDTKLRNKGFSVGIDRVDDNISYGIYTNNSQLKLDNSASAKVDYKVFGIYASNNFNNGIFIDYTLSYASLKNKMNAKKIGFNDTYYGNLWQTSLGIGYRLGANNYLEPSAKLIATRFNKHIINTKNININANQGALISLETGVRAGVSLNNHFSLKSELMYYNDINNSPKANAISMLDNEFDGIKDYGINAQIGITLQTNNNLSLSADFAKQISIVNDSNYKLNLGLNYKF